MSCRIAFDGIEYVGRIWFADETWDDGGLPDRGAFPGRSRDEAEARLRELVPGGELDILYNSPSAQPALTNPFVQQLRELVPDVAPKQAWTPVAQFAEQGIDAINYGPGATAAAHRQDEQVPVANLHAVYETLARFLS